MLAETPRWSRVIAERDAAPSGGVLVIATPLEGYARVRFTGGAGMLVLEGPRGTVVGPISGARSLVMRGGGVRMIETGRQREKSDPGVGRGWALVPGPYEAAAVTDDGRILRARFEIAEPDVDVEIALR